MRQSIRKQLTVVLIGCIAGVTILSCIVNSLFLETYYLLKKEKVLVGAYELLDASQTTSQEEFEKQYKKLFIDNNLSVCILGNDADASKVRMFGSGGENLYYKLLSYMFGQEKESPKVIKRTSRYVIQRAHASNSKGKVPGSMEEIELFGELSDGSLFLVASPMESLRENAKITIQFQLLVGAIGLILGVILVTLISKKATKPILELASISERMRNLDFDVKYHSGGKNEISLLGENINKMSETLEKTISELKSANIELQKDLEEKVQIDQMRTEFLSNVSHELKTPIALIQGYAEGLQEGINDDVESREFYCDVIIDEANKMNRMVKELLTLNQIEFGKEKVTMERFNLTSLIQEILQSSSILAEQKGVKIIFEESRPIYAWADEFKVEEVVTNYVTNALNHVKNENIIEVKIKEESDSLLRVTVFNTGDKIPEEELGQIWGKFYKVDKARTREYGGSGIGLSIVKAILESFHRKYGVKNYNNGVEFWFELEKVRTLEDGEQSER